MVDAEEVEAIGRRLCNWERWGADDEVGTVNYITPGKTAAVIVVPTLSVALAMGITMGLIAGWASHVG